MDDEKREETQHYFTSNPLAPSEPRQVIVRVRGLELHLWSDRGVFSHGGLDRGTKLLAQTMELRPGAEVLDWGAGYGVLGIVAAMSCPECRVTMIEINERAAALARQNAEELGVANAEVIAGEAPGALGEREFDAVISNPPLRAGRAAVELVITEASRRLRPDGELWLVIPTTKGAKTYLKFMDKLFAQTRTVTISAGYRVLWAKQRD